MAIFGMATAGWPLAGAGAATGAAATPVILSSAGLQSDGGAGRMKKSAKRIRTSHVGRLPPPKGWEDMPARLANAQVTDRVEIASQVVPAIAETVKKQVEIGIDCVNDGEFWPARGLAHYAAHFTGLEVRPVQPGEPPTTRHS